MNTLNINLRQSKLEDMIEMQRLFVDSISVVCKNDYSPKEIEAWASSIENKERWTKKIMTQHVLIAELSNKIVGFISLENDDYLDLLYIHKDYQRQGIADRLYSSIELEAKKRGTKMLKSNVSKTAISFFERKGFKTIDTNCNIIRGVEIINYRMSKVI
jgi:putative acetyltransferase